MRTHRTPWFAVVLFALILPAALLAQLPQADSASSMRRAEGMIFDTTTLDPEPHWSFTGPFLLACGPTPCADATPGAIVFDMTVVMVRPDGEQSHSHSFTSFIGESVEVIDDTLIIEGTIVGSGAIGGLNDIRIEFRDVGEAGEFAVELVGNNHVQGELGGVITGSR